MRPFSREHMKICGYCPAETGSPGIRSCAHSVLRPSQTFKYAVTRLLWLPTSDRGGGVASARKEDDIHWGQLGHWYEPRQLQWTFSPSGESG